MTWLEFKQRCEELGVRDSDEIEWINIMGSGKFDIDVSPIHGREGERRIAIACRKPGEGNPPIGSPGDLQRPASRRHAKQTSPRLIISDEEWAAAFGDRRAPPNR